MTVKKVTFFLFVGTLLMVSCSGGRKLSNRNLASLYTPDLNFTFPDFRYYSFSADSVQLWYRIKTTDFLAQQTDSAGGFNLQIGIQGILYPSFSSRIGLDTFFVSHRIPASAAGTALESADSSSAANASRTPEVLEGHISFRAVSGTDCVLQVFVTDLNRNSTVTDYIRIDRTGKQPYGDFLPRDAASGWVLIRNFTDKTDTIQLESALHQGKPAYLRYFSRNYPIALPPFSAAESAKLSYFSDYSEQLNQVDQVMIETNTTGICHVQFDTLEMEGFTYFRFPDDYPKLTDAWSLIESIRYLTTRQEYDRLLNSTNKKEAIDDFWLSLAGNQERARVLIRNYYSRVQLANEWFTSYLEGWKSDRGLIFVIFGPPAAVYRDETSESWNYSSSSSFGSLIFTFDRVRNPFTENDYKLRRNANYEGPWYRAVDGWREGKVIDGNN